MLCPSNEKGTYIYDAHMEGEGWARGEVLKFATN